MTSCAGAFFAKDREQVILKFKELIDRRKFYWRMTTKTRLLSSFVPCLRMVCAVCAMPMS